MVGSPDKKSGQMPSKGKQPLQVSEEEEDSRRIKRPRVTIRDRGESSAVAADTSSSSITDIATVPPFPIATKQGYPASSTTFSANSFPGPHSSNVPAQDFLFSQSSNIPATNSLFPPPEPVDANSLIQQLLELEAQISGFSSQTSSHPNIRYELEQVTVDLVNRPLISQERPQPSFPPNFLYRQQANPNLVNRPPMVQRQSQASFPIPSPSINSRRVQGQGQNTTNVGTHFIYPQQRQNANSVNRPPAVRRPGQGQNTTNVGTHFIYPQQRQNANSVNRPPAVRRPGQASVPCPNHRPNPSLVNRQRQAVVPQQHQASFQSPVPNPNLVCFPPPEQLLNQRPIALKYGVPLSNPVTSSISLPQPQPQPQPQPPVNPNSGNLQQGESSTRDQSQVPFDDVDLTSPSTAGQFSDEFKEYLKSQGFPDS